MLYDEVVLPSADIAPPPAEDGGEDEQGLEDVEVKEGFESPAAPTSTIARSPREMEDVQREMRTTHWTRAEVEEVNDSSELMANRRSERQSAKQVSKILERRTSRRLAAKPISAAYLLLIEIIGEPLNLAEARRTPQWYEWEAATWTEVRALEANDT
ncbi:hypothetical protein PF005_g11402 [Phytophthora fragariae]|uniref:Uncharacterized protein n=1 Tax=Phytophthora fragariae TaxID=53985 RepID=A0A6A4DTE4_9STRA|nr:hypothetical protein PF003_g31320 [Phytophthora fragariae]KAE8938031.1 hypothetical protein PF009_g12077 [Phytophthora fragariae]KAE9011291.1 hypothetical protein PF011_g9436 [Phytophthora fragariae]KAE9111547.1 hypothetical protein PF010_g10768 [Phytophthora fragariae]KAE9138605.1 hypothetical protein PF007_g1338 [Phytophthora fragariae]